MENKEFPCETCITLPICIQYVKHEMKELDLMYPISILRIKYGKNCSILNDYLDHAGFRYLEDAYEYWEKKAK